MKGEIKMKELLIRCYYDSMTLEEAINFVKNSYNGGRDIPKRTIENTLKEIRKTTNRDWK